MRRRSSPESVVVYVTTPAIVTDHATFKHPKCRIAAGEPSVFIAVRYERNIPVILQAPSGIHLVESRVGSGELLPF
jgi:hypothetical protein